MHRPSLTKPLSLLAGRLAAAGLLLGCLSALAAAQTAIFNIPSTETQEAKKLYLEGDFYAHIAPYADGGFHSYSPVVIYGVSKQVEVGANLVYERGEGDATLELQPNAKWKFFEREEAGVAASVGGELPYVAKEGLQVACDLGVVRSVSAPARPLPTDYRLLSTGY
jgi:hypothetical protein